jgi:hypothetical protein
MDARYFGKYNIDGGIAEYPAVDLSGQPLNMPPGTLCGVGNGCFVVLPVGGDWSAAVEEARAYLSPRGKAVEVKAETVEVKQRKATVSSKPDRDNADEKEGE